MCLYGNIIRIYLDVSVEIKSEIEIQTIQRQIMKATVRLGPNQN